MQNKYLNALVTPDAPVAIQLIVIDYFRVPCVIGMRLRLRCDRQMWRLQVVSYSAFISYTGLVFKFFFILL